jgi:hypothetical protein
MMNCKTQTILSYIAAICILASIYYLARKGPIGTPFTDSLSQQQILLKTQSANTRRKLFYEGCVLAVVLLAIAKPFKECRM